MEIQDSPIPPFVNEPYADFKLPRNAEAMRAALSKVRAEFGREYDMLIAGENRKSAGKLQSSNPSKPSEIIGVHQAASEADARDAVERAAQYFPTWSQVKAEDRVAMLLRVAAIIRKRKMEFDAWLVFEAGKTWAEAEADVAEAIDFCEYYARQLLKLAHPDPVVQLPGERDEMVYLPLGVGVIIPPWNFPLAILAGMTTAALVAGNTVVIKPSSDTPTIAAKFAEVLLEAGFPARIVFAADRQRRGHRRCSGAPSQDAICVVHRIARCGAAYQRTGRQDAERADLDQARGGGNGRQRRHCRGSRNGRR